MSLQSIYSAIYAEHGRLDPNEIEAEAREEDHPLHPYLEWDDTEAGIKYRRLQIQKHLRSIEIVREVYAPKPREVTVRQFIATQDARRYVPIEVVESDPLLMEQVRARMKRELDDLKARYRAHEQIFMEVVQEAYVLSTVA